MTYDVTYHILWVNYLFGLLYWEIQTLRRETFARDEVESKWDTLRTIWKPRNCIIQQNVKEVVYRFYDSAKISRPKQTNNTDGGDYRSQIQIHVIFLGLLLRHQTELLMESRLVVAKSRWCHGLDLDCLQDTLWHALFWKKVFVMQRLW